jgi:hypothetical protein
MPVIELTDCDDDLPTDRGFRFRFERGRCGECASGGFCGGRRAKQAEARA